MRMRVVYETDKRERGQSPFTCKSGDVTAVTVRVGVHISSTSKKEKIITLCTLRLAWQQLFLW